MSIEMLGPELSETNITPIDGRLAIIMTNAIAAASCRIDMRSILSAIAISAFAARAIDVADYRVRTYVERVVLTNLVAVGTEQKCGHRMSNRSVALAPPAELEQRKDLVNSLRRTSQENPSVPIRMMPLRVLREFRGTVVLGIERY